MRERVLILAILCACGIAWAQPETAKTTQPATEPAEQVDERPPEVIAAEEAYQRVVDAYMDGEFDELDEQITEARRSWRYLNRQQRKDILYIRKTAPEYRPQWWPKTHSSTAVSFPAKIWKRGFMANYMPTEALGYMAPVGIRNGRIQVIVSWKPNLVDSPHPAEGSLAELHEIRKGDLGEVVVWHELGHNYITVFLPLRHAITLYNEHFMLFSHLQEFYADITALYHSSPKARLTTLFLRTDALQWYRESEPHTRGAHAIGSIILATVLENPKAWPSFRLPGKVPQENIELNTIRYLYDHIDTDYSLEEDRALRDMINDWIRRHGEEALRRKGEIILPNKLSMMIMAGDDRKAQSERDAWVADKLKEAIAAGLTDDPEEQSDQPDHQVITVNGTKILIRGSGSRIEIPW